MSHSGFLSWSEDDQDKMLALKLYEDTMVCPMCGGPISECTDPDNEIAYKVDPPTRCHKTTALMRAQGDEWTSRPYYRALMLVARLVKPQR